MQDNSVRLYTLMNGDTGTVEDKVDLGPYQHVDALLELDGMYMAELEETSKADGIAKLVTTRPEEAVTFLHCKIK